MDGIVSCFACLRQDPLYWCQDGCARLSACFLASCCLKHKSTPAGTIYPKDGHLSKAQGRLVERFGPVKGWSFVADADSYQVLQKVLMTMMGPLL